MKDKYIKVVYESEPIGTEKIILYLTTFDIDKYNHDLEEKRFGIEIPIKKHLKDNEDYLQIIENRINDYVKRFYEPYIQDAKGYVKYLQNEIIQPRIYDNVKNVNNVEKITCNNIYGNVNNCEVLYCNEIKGKVNNVEKIVYKK